MLVIIGRESLVCKLVLRITAIVKVLTLLTKFSKKTVFTHLR